MHDAGMLGAKINHHQFDVPIQRPVSDMWRVMVEDINAWWSADFRIFGESSTVSLDATAGGQLLETDGQGGCLLSVSDTLLGNTTEKSSQQSMNGWRTLFGDSLKAYAEAQ